MRFWQDKWLPGIDSLASMVLHPIPQHERFFMVSHYGEEAGWRWDRFQQYLPDHICLLIAAVKPPSGASHDFPGWGPSSNGQFTLKSAYHLLYSQLDRFDPLCFDFSKVWQWNGPQQVRTFLWQAVHDRLLTNEARARRGMSSDSTCPYCLNQPETLMHVLRDCEFALQVWSHLVPHE